MALLRDERAHKNISPQSAKEAGSWKKTVARTFLTLDLIPDKFNGELVVSFKDGGVSYLRKTETYK